MKNDTLFDDLLTCLKEIKDNYLEFPSQGSQKHYKVIAKNTNEEFTLIINRKGHLNKHNLTYQMMSQSLKGILVRLDWSGAPHENVETPHLHIFNDDYDNGRIAIPIQHVTKDVAEELYDSLIYFLDYTHTRHDTLTINTPMI